MPGDDEVVYEGLKAKDWPCQKNSCIALHSFVEGWQ